MQGALARTPFLSWDRHVEGTSFVFAPGDEINHLIALWGKAEGSLSPLRTFFFPVKKLIRTKK